MAAPEGSSPRPDGDLAGRRFVVTGASSGIGEAAALAFAARGAHVLLACRDRARGDASTGRITAAVPGADVEVGLVDLASQASVRTFADTLLEAGDPLDVLVNNAGVMALPRRESVDGFELQLATNHLGHFALTGRLLPLLLAAPAARVVTVSSIAHRKARLDFDDLQSVDGYQKWEAYGRSKLANLLFAFELQRRADAAGVALLSMGAHPGITATNLFNAGPGSGGGRISALSARAATLFAQRPAGGARPTVLAATGVGLSGGSFLGPSGPFQAWGPATLVAAAPAAHDPLAARLLWDASEDLTGVTFGALDAAVS